MRVTRKRGAFESTFHERHPGRASSSWLLINLRMKELVDLLLQNGGQATRDPCKHGPGMSAMQKRGIV